jgi:2-polyprenyl-3-methyl-5-hydroxy-6-metoxy-1,4-benzoquinol methylase
MRLEVILILITTALVGCYIWFALHHVLHEEHRHYESLRTRTVPNSEAYQLLNADFMLPNIMSKSQSQSQSPPPMPSIRVNNGESSANSAFALRKQKGYGGEGDGLHLGGFKVAGLDHEGISNNTWNYMMGKLGVKSLVDLGCGIGVSSNYFRENGARVLCIEGSHDAVEHSLLPATSIVEHDFTRGPWWPQETFDALWCVDVLEHIGRQYFENIVPTLKKSAILFLSISNNGGWHHVEVRQSWWWKAKLESLGFVYSQDLSKQIRDVALATSVRNSGGRIIRRMQVFMNPVVASLPEHAHLFSGDGCLFEKNREVPCDTRFKWFSKTDVVPARFQPLLNCEFEPLDASLKDLHGSTPVERPAYGVFSCTKNERAFV